MDRYAHKSLPQMQARVTLTSAFVDSMMEGSGTFSILTSRAACMMVARTGVYLTVIDCMAVNLGHPARKD